MPFSKATMKEWEKAEKGGKGDNEGIGEHRWGRL